MPWGTLATRLAKPFAGLYGPQVSEHSPYILVVEDEPVIRCQIAVILEDEGFRVRQAGDAAEAYALLMEQPDITLLITDVRLPGAVDGAGLAKVVETLNPGLPILAISGGQQPSADDMPLRTAFLPKPIVSTELVFVVNALMQRPRA